jgi:phosphohistidine phosphatase
MLIGHNPSLQQLASTLAAGGDGLQNLQAKFPTAAPATLEIECSWDQLAPGDAILTAYVVPKQLR